MTGPGHERSNPSVSLVLPSVVFPFFFVNLKVYSMDFLEMIGGFPKVLMNFNRLFLKLNWFIYT